MATTPQTSAASTRKASKATSDVLLGRPWGHWLGRYGEEAAAHYLLGAGYQVLDRNWVCRDPDLRGELDLVARYRRTVVACEVKTRAGDRLAHPIQAITPEKAARLRLLATRWLHEHHQHQHRGQRPTAPSATRPRSPQLLPPRTQLRIDVIAIRTSPRPPYPLRSLDHLVGVA
ncbi:MAG TPA: YraN family protein [Actinocrinis sp.]|uniref:YraN family protein n=1 Tax=Actinocrinis sp. TaxID=1920516 RepID=UPI002DDCCCAB|nr:YraN family protein [Actinocrinis sp.]HEV2345046.1 YraN family protein [Actinocrinis sp.]